MDKTFTNDSYSFSLVKPWETNPHLAIEVAKNGKSIALLIPIELKVEVIDGNFTKMINLGETNYNQSLMEVINICKNATCDPNFKDCSATILMMNPERFNFDGITFKFHNIPIKVFKDSDCDELINDFFKEITGPCSPVNKD